MPLSFYAADGVTPLEDEITFRIKTTTATHSAILSVMEEGSRIEFKGAANLFKSISGTILKSRPSTDEIYITIRGDTRNIIRPPVNADAIEIISYGKSPEYTDIRSELGKTLDRPERGTLLDMQGLRTEIPNKFSIVDSEQPTNSKSAYIPIFHETENYSLNKDISSTAPVINLDSGNSSPGSGCYDPTTKNAYVLDNGTTKQIFPYHIEDDRWEHLDNFKIVTETANANLAGIFAWRNFIGLLDSTDKKIYFYNSRAKNWKRLHDRKRPFCNWY